MSDLACDREFKVGVGGDQRRLVVEWMTPVRDRGSWRCDFIIHWPHQDAFRAYAFGVDSTQAILLAMGVVRGLVEHDYPDVAWLDAGQGTGLPMVPFPDQRE